MDFTSDTDSLVTFIDEVQATGGGDTPEDIAGGLNQGLSMNWREKSAKYAILIAMLLVMVKNITILMMIIQKEIPMD